MLKDGHLNRVFIRTAIILLRSVAPLCIGYCTARIVIAAVKPDLIQIPKPLLIGLDIYATAEASFYFLVYLPRTWYLNRSAPPFTPFNTRAERSEIFDKVWDVVPDPKKYVSGWFKWAPVEELRREDVKDWISWRVWNKTERDAEDEDELEDYLARTEEALNMKFEDGRSGHQSMMVTFEPLRIRHRPLLWYLFFIGGADLAMCLIGQIYGYTFYTLPISRFFTSSFPLRPLSIFPRYRSPSRELSYWHLPHTSADPSHVPVLFIHGIGVGLHFYLDFLREFKQQLHQTHGIGMTALEIMPVASRITTPILPAAQFATEVKRILDYHGYTRFVLATHSYGSVLAAHLLRSPATRDMIADLLFVDPVAFSFHRPYVPWNFLRRQPRKASEWIIWYFSSTDPDVARVLTRSFVWTENSLWREDIEGRVIIVAAGKNRRGRCTVTASGGDIITDTETLGRYMTRKPEGRWYEQTERGRQPYGDAWKSTEWTGDKALEMIWFPELNHAEVFDGKEERAKLLKVLSRYATENEENVSRNSGILRDVANGSASATNERTPLLAE